MKITKLNNMSLKKYNKILKRSLGNQNEILPDVKSILESMRKNGDGVLISKYQGRFGKNAYRSIQVTTEEFKDAHKNVDSKIISSLFQMIKNITEVHKAQLPKKKDFIVSPEKGIFVWREWRPIEKVGLYIPGGKAVYPSSVLMCGIPALIAGCSEIVLCSPPDMDGKIPAATLVAADLLGLQKIFKVGGAEAIAAMAYGTESIPKVYKIFGAGNSYVTLAKMLVFGEVAIDMPAGPSEIFIIADGCANPSYIAADLLADGEHGEDSACVVITTSLSIAEKTADEIEKQLRILPTQNRAREALKRYGLIAIVDSIDEAINFTNEYAPEHLEIMVKNPKAIVKKIKNAGSVFLGDFTSKSSGDYATGANHILPTGGMAKMYPPLGVDGFGKWMQVQKCTKNGLRQIKDTVETIAQAEGLPAHKNSASIRFMKE